MQTLLVSYIYDALNQLVRENNAERDKTIVYTYDNGGNLTSVKEYAYTTGAVSGTPITEKTYSYGNTEWKDLLTNYNGVDITYDAIGNPINWTNGKTFTWTAGRQLSGVKDAANTITYTYDDSGIRTSKTVNGVKTDYYLNGTAIIMQKTGDNCIWYTYDESGNVSGLRVGNSEYYYYRNGQGDIIGIIDGTGSILAKYSYDAWGTPIAITDGAGNDVSSNASHIANINPFRYRGYFYDTETGLYYLQSRYYDPQVGRFLNADGVSLLGYELQKTMQYNMYSYCWNNPENMYDPTGEFPIFLFIISLVTKEKNYNHNKEQTQLPQGFINDQFEIDYMKMGFYGADWNGCGWIATYNVMLMLGRPQPAADIIKHYDKMGNNILFGTFGAAPGAVTRYFSNQGVKGKYNAVPFEMPPDIETVAQNASACMILYAHSRGAHYAAFQWDGTRYNVYNDNIDKFSSIKDYMRRVGGTFAYIWCFD